MRLIHFSAIEEKNYLAYMREWEATGELIVPWASRREGKSFEEIQAYWSVCETDVVYAKGYVPATLYFLVDDIGYPYGAIHLRHELNDFLLKHGGHIGYGVRPSQRRKGYGKLMLKLLLELLHEKGFKKVMVSCDDDNEGSARTIEYNGGKLENRIVDDGVLVRRYWIQL